MEVVVKTVSVPCDHGASVGVLIRQAHRFPDSHTKGPLRRNENWVSYCIRLEKSALSIG